MEILIGINVAQIRMIRILFNFSLLVGNEIHLLVVPREVQEAVGAK